MSELLYESIAWLLDVLITGMAGIALLWVAWVHLGYPLVVALLALPRAARTVAAPEVLPRVSVLVPACDAAADIEATIRDRLALDYPARLLEVVVVSDASGDDTDAIVGRLAEETSDRVRLHRLASRQGRTAALNAAVALAQGEVLLFSDARSRWNPRAARALVANFADPDVGYVTGRLRYAGAADSLLAYGGNAVQRFDDLLRRCESRLGSTIDVHGLVDAMPRVRYTPLRADQRADVLQPMKVIERGGRVVFEAGAVAELPAPADEAEEVRRQADAALGSMHALREAWGFLGRRRRPLLAFQLVSHKVLRWLLWLPLALLLPMSVLLGETPLWAFVAAAQLLVYGLLLGTRIAPGLEDVGLVRVARYLVLRHLACARATLAYRRGAREIDGPWTPFGDDSFVGRTRARLRRIRDWRPRLPWRRTQRE